MKSKKILKIFRRKYRRIALGPWIGKDLLNKTKKYK